MISFLVLYIVTAICFWVWEDFFIIIFATFQFQCNNFHKQFNYTDILSKISQENIMLLPQNQVTVHELQSPLPPTNVIILTE